MNPQALADRLEKLQKQKLEIEKEIDLIKSKLKTKSNPKPKSFSKDQKISIFKSLFFSSNKYYATFWSNKDGSKTSFYAATKTFKGSDYLFINDDLIESHLRGEKKLASYPTIKQKLCKYITINLKGNRALDDAKNISQITKSFFLDVYFERQSDGIRGWLFFEDMVKIEDATFLVKTILSKTTANVKSITPSAEVYDNSLGSYVSLPLFLKERTDNLSIFIDIELNKEYEDQWLVLSNIKKIQTKQLKSLIVDQQTNPWQEEKNGIIIKSKELNITLFDAIYIEKSKLDISVIKYLKELSSFKNPTYEMLIKMRRPAYNIPKVVICYSVNDKYIIIPRGLFENIKEFFTSHGVKLNIEDKRGFKEDSFPKVKFTLRPEQDMAIKNILKSDSGLCIAPPGFGKTLIGAKMIELRSCSTLIVVNKNMLLNQWIERFVDYFEMDKKEVGILGKSKNTLNGKLDVATMQSLKNNPDIVQNYSQVIVDEAHHIPAVTFEQIIQKFSGKYILGLSATPNRKDGMEPILYMQIGNVAYEFKKTQNFKHELIVVNTEFESTEENYSKLVNEVANDMARNNLIVEQIKKYSDRTILILTDRIEHIENLQRILDGEKIEYISVHGSQSKKEQKENMDKVADASLVLATTSFFGEGIDFPHLNTIIFATPISYYGRLVQYLGRIGRGGGVSLAIDLVDKKNGLLASSFRKRKEGYKQMHYKIVKEVKG